MIGIDNYEYAQWVINIGRSLRFNPALPPEGPMCEAFYQYEVIRRPWLWDKFFRTSEREQGLVTDNNPQVLGQIIEAVGRNLMKIPVLDADEKTWVDALIANTDDRRFGNMGNRIGSDVHQP